MCLTHDSFVSQHILEPTRGARVLDMFLYSKKELVNNVKMQESLGKITSNKTNVKQWEIRNCKEILAHLG